MKKMLHNACRSLFAVMFVAGALTACSDTEEEPVGGENGPLAAPVATIAGVSSNEIYIKWEAVENAKTYGYTIDDGQARGGAPEEGVQYTANLHAILSDLEPQLTYKIRVKAIAPVNSGWADSEYSEIEVKTAGKVEGELFDFSDLNTSPVGVKVTVTPKNPNTVYFLVNASQIAIKQAGSLEEYALKQMMFYSTYPDEYWNDMKVINMQENGGFKKGEYTFDITSGLIPDRDYAVIAIAIDLDTRAFLGVDQAEYKTPTSGGDVEFNVDIKSRGFRSVAFDILPSSGRVPYRYEMVPAEKYEGLTDEEIIEMIVSDPTSAEYTGNVTGLLFDRMTPDKEYAVYVVGSVKGVATSELKTVKFITRKFEFNKEGTSTIEMGPDRMVFSNPGSEWAAGIVAVGANVTSPVDTAFYRVAILPKDVCDALSEQELGELAYEAHDNLKSQDFESVPWTRVPPTSDWHPFGAFFWPNDARVKVGTAYYMLALEWGPNGVFAPIQKFEFTPTNVKQPTTFEFVGKDGKTVTVNDSRGEAFFEWEQKNWYANGPVDDPENPDEGGTV